MLAHRCTFHLDGFINRSVDDFFSDMTLLLGEE